MNFTFFNYILKIKNIIINNIRSFFRLNLIAFKINSFYKINVYLLFFLFICIISSIIIRTQVINEDILLYYININNIKIIINILIIFAIIYCLKLILDIFIKCIQLFKIIPDFIKWHKQKNIKDIKMITIYFYFQQIFFILLSSWILYNILIKLNLFIEDIYMYIISLGVLCSLLFINYYNIKEFNFNFNNNMKNYPIWVYLLILFFIIFYMLILPLIVINVINSDKFIEFKQDFINNCVKNTKPHCIIGSDNNNINGSTVRLVTPYNRTINSIESSNNSIIDPNDDLDDLALTLENNIITNNNLIEVVNRNVVTNNSNISNLNPDLNKLQSPTNASTNNLLQSKNTTKNTTIITNNLNKLRKFKSVIDLKLSNIFDKSEKIPDISYQFSKKNIFLIPNEVYNNILSTSNEIYNFSVLNKLLMDNENLFRTIDALMNDAQCFVNIQSKLRELIENENSYNKETVDLILFRIADFNKIYYFSKNEIYNKELNMIIYDILKEIFNINLDFKGNINKFSLLKLKEYYVLNDLDYLNFKNDKTINVTFFKNVKAFKNEMNNVLNTYIKHPEFSTSVELKKELSDINELYFKFLASMDKLYKHYNNITRGSINRLLNYQINENVDNVKYKEIDRLRKTRIIAYYEYIFKNYNK